MTRSAVILLAATDKDGAEAIAASLASFAWNIVTPRTSYRARGLSVAHIFRTPAFAALPGHLRNPVEYFATPATVMSDCPICSVAKSHESDGAES